MFLRFLLLAAAVLPSFAACTFTLSPMSASFGFNSNDGVINVTASASDCVRTASSNTSWITISFGQSGTGSGTVGYTVSQNNTFVSRSGSLTVAGNIFNITQAAAPCTYALSPGSGSVPAAGGSGSFNVTTGCAWTATSNADWISTSDSGTGSGTIHYTAAANTLSTSRSGSISVGTQTFTVTQPAPCTFSTNPASAQVAYTATSGTFMVVAAPNTCAWTATSNNPDFLTVTSGAAGTGNGTVGYSVASNISGGARSGTISVADAVFSVSQAAGPGCSFALSSGSASFSAVGGSGFFTVSANCPWTVSSSADWISVNASTTTGNGTVAFSVGANPSTQARSAIIIVGASTFTVFQAGLTCSVTGSPIALAVPAGGGNGSIDVTAADGCNWSATSGAAWITLQTSSGTGTGSVAWTAAANTTSQVRSGNITIANQVIKLTQDAADCSGAAVVPDHTQIPAAGGTFSFHLTTSCSYSAVTTNGWITIVNGSGTGTADITYRVGQNTSTSSRQGSITVAGLQFAVSQDGLNAGVTISPASASMDARGGIGVISVTCPSACSWSPTTDQGWITLTYASANGTGKINYTVAANSNTTTRTGNVFVGGQTFQITQAGMPPLQVSSDGVVNAASFRGGPIAPGEIVTIFGTGIGPARPAGAQLATDQKSILNMIGSVRILFDGVPAPMLYASATQASAIVPYAVAGKTSSEMRVEYQGFLSGSVPLDVAPTASGIFTLNGSGSGQGAILNQDNTINGAAAPAAKGSIVVLYATGAGQTRPGGVDGQIAGAPLPAPIALVSVQIGGLDAVITYAGAAPSFPAGVLQVNARVPAGVASGAQTVTLKVGNAVSQPGVTVAVQ
jgi:uncharacterized protein (TIGR03437 family)